MKIDLSDSDREAIVAALRFHAGSYTRLASRDGQPSGVISQYRAAANSLRLLADKLSTPLTA